MRAHAAGREPTEDLLFEPVRPPAAHESDMAAMSGLYEAHRRRTLDKLGGGAVRWNERIILRIEQQGRDTNARQVRSAAGVRVVLVDVAEAVEATGECFVEFAQAAGRRRGARVEGAG